MKRRSLVPWNEEALPARSHSRTVLKPGLLVARRPPAKDLLFHQAQFTARPVQASDTVGIHRPIQAG